MKNFNRLFIGAMLILSISAQAQDGLFISEITDPADVYSGRFIELFNAGAEAVDFSAITLYLSRQSNGGTGWGDVQLTGTVAAGETFVFGGSAFEDVYGFPPDQETGIIIGNGDDAYFLYQDGDHSAGTLHDIFGAIDMDGTGEPWEYEDSRAVRIEGVIAPNTTWSAAEWEITSANVADADPGTHHGSGTDDTLDLPGDYSLTILNDTAGEGQPVEVLIFVSELTTADNIISYQFNLNFDTSVLEYTGIDIAGTIAEGGEIAVNANIAGNLSISYMNLTPLIGTGALLKLQFNSLALDTTEISISNAYLNNLSVQDLTNGTMIIRKVIPPTAAITYSDTINRFADTLVITATFSEIMDEANAVLLNLSGAANLAGAEMIRQSTTVYTYSYQIPKADGDVSVSLSNGTDIWGNEVDSIPTSGVNFHIVKFTLGDVDDDGTILAYDAAITLQHSVGLDPLPAIDPLPWENWRDSTANVDGISGITAYDAGLILQYSAGIITGFSGESNKSFSVADVSVDIVGNEIIFYSWGELLGLNLSTTNEYEILGMPQVLNENFMSAFNNRGTTYNIGLCTAFSPEDGSAIMKIPFNKSGSVTFNMLVNTEKKSVTLNRATGMIEFGNKDISIYPNPARDQLFINTGKYYKMSGYQLKIINQLGVTVFKTKIKEPLYEINLSDWSGPGLYYLQVIEKAGSMVATRKIIIQ
ncbi:MAG: T9SS type A sorting domain-containing protein [Bacteroidales bacterium]|nr:T9SS type A sorting domain-containing protein [Bacteroidales bacterium]